MTDIRRSRNEAVGQPGTDGIWTFVFIDMIVFLVFFFVYLTERARLPEVYARSQAHLDFTFGLVNALVLLTSSLFMVEAVHAARAGRAKAVGRNLGLCLLMGAAFSINKLMEYHAKLELGVTPATNSFYSFYYIITGLHFLHVLGCMVFITHCALHASAETGSEDFRRKIENVGLFWHFVDMLWLFIFPMIYLAGHQ